MSQGVFMKRTYQSQNRKLQAQETKNKILLAIKKLLNSKSYNEITIPQIATAAGVSTPTIYALYKSKAGVLKALLDSATETNDFAQFVIKTKSAVTLEEKLAQASHMTTQIYAAEKEMVSALKGLAGLSEELNRLEQEQEERRYSRQEDTVKLLLKHNNVSSDLNLKQARDLFWTFTSRDFYRLLVIERGWTPTEFEQFLRQFLLFVFQKS